jgi:hypothetical protein
LLKENMANGFANNPFGGTIYGKPKKPVFNPNNRISKSAGTDKQSSSIGGLTDTLGDITEEAIDEGTDPSILGLAGGKHVTFRLPSEGQAEADILAKFKALLPKAQSVKTKDTRRKAIDRSGLGVGRQGILSLLTGSLTGVKSSKTGV